ncbi:MAG: CoA transferase, partial [Paracoccaceae bacterium]
GPECSTDPVAHALPPCDCIAGNMAVSGLLAAERHRLRKGEGQSVDLTLKDVAAAMLGNLGILADVAINEHDREKAGNALYGAYGHDFVCGDGRRVMVIGLTHRQWRTLLKVTQSEGEIDYLSSSLRQNFHDEGVRWRFRHKITAALAPWFRARRVQDFADDFTKAGITWSEFRSFSQAMAEDPDISEENPMFTMLDQPDIGQYLTPGSPVAFSALAREDARPAPGLGEHTEEVLADVVGLPDSEIANLYDSGVVGDPSTMSARAETGG